MGPSVVEVASELSSVQYNLMGVINRFAPNCCCVSCVFWADDFNRASLGTDWTQVSGSWSISSNALSSPSTGVITTPASTSTDMVVIVDYTTSAGGVVQIIVNYLDASNYNYLQITQGSPGTLKLFEVVGGTPNELASLSATIATSDTARVCQGNGVLTGYLMNTANYVSTASHTTHSSGYKAGLETTGTAATFDNFHGYVVTAGCPFCTLSFSACYCNTGTEPTNYRVDITGATTWDAFNCSSTTQADFCDMFEGSYTTTQAACDWDSADHHVTSCGAGTDVRFQVRVSILKNDATNPTTLKWQVRLRQLHSSGAYTDTFFESDELFVPINCDAIAALPVAYTTTVDFAGGYEVCLDTEDLVVLVTAI